MSWRTPGTGSRPLPRPSAWGDPSAVAELHLLKLPAGGAPRSFAAKQKSLIEILTIYVILLGRRTKNRDIEARHVPSGKLDSVRSRDAS
jgi:hypothetical protein